MAVVSDRDSSAMRSLTEQLRAHNEQRERRDQAPEPRPRRSRVIAVRGADIFHVTTMGDEIAVVLKSGDVAVVDAAAARTVLAKLEGR